MIDIRNMLKSMVVALNFFLIAATPILANCNYLRNDLFPRIAHMLSLHQISADTTILAVALTTLYAYVVLGFVNDLVQVNHQNALAELEKYPDSVTAQRRVARSLSVCLFTERAQQEVRQLFPAYAVSALLSWANTNRFDTLRSSFVVIQSLFLFGLSVTHGCTTTRLINYAAYRAALFWTVLYGLMPRETTYITYQLVESLALPNFSRASSDKQEYIL